MVDIYDHLATLLKNYYVKGVLDVGAGTGTLGLYLREYGFTGPYKGVDKDPEMCDLMHERRLDADEGDVKWLDYKKNTWNAVVMQDVLEHLENISYITNAILVARTYFILTTEAPIIDSLSPAPHPPLHFRVDDLLSLAQVCNFRLHDFQRCGNHSILIFKRRVKRR